MASRPKFPFTPVSVKRDERQVIVSINNPHTQGKEVADFLRRFCTVVRDPTKIIDENVFCTANWSVTIRLWSDPSSPDGLQHLPITSNLGNSEAFITYLEMPPICEGSASIICQTPCQKFKDWLWKTSCDLQGRENHVNVECPRRASERFIKKEDKMAGLFPIPIEMREELLAGVNYIKTLANRFRKLDPVKVELFGGILAVKLCQKYIGHWYPEKPMKGQAYRCITINRGDRDESILKACAYSGLKYHELTLPKVMTLWIDPYEVSCRLGEKNYPYTVARFDRGMTRVLDASLSVEQQQPSSSLYVNCSTPKKEDDSIGGSSLPSSPSLTSEDRDSGIDSSSDGTTTPPISHSPTQELIWGNPAANQASTPVFRTPSPLWIPAWRVPHHPFLSTDPQQVYWL